MNTMITDESIKEYLDRMYGNELYKEIDNNDQEKVIFAAHELLKDNFKEKDITVRAVALQVLYMLDSDESDFSSLKNQGVTSYSVKGVSVSFADFKSESSSGNRSGLIAPVVMDLLNPNGGAKVGRLI